MKQQIKCPNCDKIFDDLNSLIRHLCRSKNHMSSKEYYDHYLLKSNSDGLCVICGCPTKFECCSRGYYKTCSSKCKNILSSKTAKIFTNDNLVQMKRKSTCIQRYGVDNPFKYKKFKDKSRKTCIDKYGVDNPMKIQHIQDDIKLSNLVKYGYENPAQSQLIKNKIKKTNLFRYGVEYASQLSSNRDRYRQTCMNRYGVDNYSKTYEFRLKARESFLHDLSIQKNKGLPIKGRIGKLEMQCLKELQAICKYNMTRPQLIGYLPDSYIDEINLVIEFDENWHKHAWADNHDIQKDLDYKKSGFNIFRIKQDEWEYYPNLTKKRFILIIDKLEN